MKSFPSIHQAQAFFLCAHWHSDGIIVLQVYANSLQFSPSACSRTVPSPSLDISVDIFVLFDGSKNVSTGSEVRRVFDRPRSCAWLAVHLNSTLSHNSSPKHTVFEDKFGMDFQVKLIIPITLNTAFRSVGLGFLSIVCTLLLSGSTPCYNSLSPRNINSLAPNLLIQFQAIFPYSL